MLAKDPDERPASMAEVLEALEAPEEDYCEEDYYYGPAEVVEALSPQLLLSKGPLPPLELELRPLAAGTTPPARGAWESELWTSVPRAPRQ